MLPSRYSNPQSLSDLLIYLNHARHCQCHSDSEWNGLINRHARLIWFALQLQGNLHAIRHHSRFLAVPPLMV